MPIMEASIALHDSNGGIEFGDIVNIRMVKNGTGKKVPFTYLKIALEANDISELNILNSSFDDGKKRFRIYLNDLKKYKLINNDKLLDKNILYQPFMPLSDNEYGEFEFLLNISKPYSIYGLVFDKKYWKYL